jgi:hypothetical protein
VVCWIPIYMGTTEKAGANGVCNETVMVGNMKSYIA